ncbi:MAG: class I SAM-dependent methyltransferase [Gemmatimonadota bacterium]|jgi:SAM-dependent methyltransferase
MAEHDWNEHYVAGELPWDTGEPAPQLVELVEEGVIPPGRVLEVGCGTGTNSIWLAGRGFDVHGVDISERAIEMAKSKARSAEGSIELAALDFMHDELPAGPFDFVFDRGVMHVFDDAADRARFAERVAGLLGPGGRWLCIAGSTEGPPREHGPPRRSARDLLAAVEPVLELVWLRSSALHPGEPSEVMAWAMLSCTRSVPAQPSTMRAE